MPRTKSKPAPIDPEESTDALDRDPDSIISYTDEDEDLEEVPEDRFEYPSLLDDPYDEDEDEDEDE